MIRLLKSAVTGAATAALIYAISHIPVAELLSGEMEIDWEDDECDCWTCFYGPAVEVIYIIVEEDHITDLI